MQEKIVVLDFGSQYTQLIARKIRELKIYSEILPFHTDRKTLSDPSVKGIILSGGPASVNDTKAPLCDHAIFDLDKPILGICYGFQLMAKLHGGEVKKSNTREYGRADLSSSQKNILFQNIDFQQTPIVWMSHSDSVLRLPSEFTAIAQSGSLVNAAAAHTSKPWWGLQFHPEVHHSQAGNTILKNFSIDICKVSHSWNMGSFCAQQIQTLREKYKNKKVLCALSGGVDSSVVATLLYQAIGDNLIAIFIDNGFLRKGERDRVVQTFSKLLQKSFFAVDASEKFLSSLEGVSDPEIKRKTIGKLFIEIFEQEAKKFSDVHYLAQGTLYPDVIESVSVKGPSSVIKSHHNVGGLPEKMNLKLIEPVRELFKDEVRLLGKELGLSDAILYNQPFPGPGLAIRVVGKITRSNVELVRAADAIVTEEFKKNDLFYKVWQSFAVLLPVYSVGVMGDERTYEQTAVIRVVDSVDGMTADWVAIEPKLLSHISNRIINEVSGINRVVFDITSKPPGTIEWE